MIGPVEYLHVVAVTLVHWPGRTVSCIQWNPSITATIGTQCFVRYSKVSLTRASGIFPVGMVLRNPAVEYNVAAFSVLSFAVRWQGRLSRG